MPRGLTQAQLAELAKRVRAPVYYVALMLASPVRIWTGTGDASVLGATWSGVGELGIIDGLGGSRELSARSISVSLVGIPADALPAGAISATRGVRYQGAALTVHLGFADTATGAPLGDPTPVWAGVADVMSFRIGETVTCTLTGEHYSARLRRANGARMTTQSHNARLGKPAVPDLFFDLQDRTAAQPRQVLK